MMPSCRGDEMGNKRGGREGERGGMKMRMETSGKAKEAVEKRTEKCN